MAVYMAMQVSWNPVILSWRSNLPGYLMLRWPSLLVQMPFTSPLMKKCFQPDLDLVKKSMNSKVRMIVVSTPCNPTGAVYTRESLRGWQKSEKNGAPSSCQMRSTKISCTKGCPTALHQSTIMSLQLTVSRRVTPLTGWRLGYVAAPPEIIEGIVKVYQQSATCVNAFAQGGALEALRNPQSRNESLKMTAGYRERRDLISRLMLESGFFKGFLPPDGVILRFSLVHIQEILTGSGGRLAWKKPTSQPYRVPLLVIVAKGICVLPIPPRKKTSLRLFPESRKRQNILNSLMVS